MPKIRASLFIVALSTALGLGGCALNSPAKASTHSRAQPVAPENAVRKFRRAPAAVIPIRYDYKDGELADLCRKAIDHTTKQLDEIAHLNSTQRTFDSVALTFEATMADFSDLTTPMTFMGYVSTNPKTHKEGSDCEDQVNQYGVTVTTRKDLYDALTDSRKENLPRTDAEKRLLSETLKGFENNGLKLPADQLDQMRKLKTELASKESQFSTNLNNNVTEVALSEADLEGIPTDFKTNLKKDAQGNFIVPVNEATYPVAMQNAVKSDTRKKLLTAYWDRAADKNVSLLESAILLREQIAKVMSYKTWADYRIHGRMAKDGDTVLDFLNGLKDKLSNRDRDDLALLKAYGGVDTVHAWDIPYLSYQMKKSKFDLDDEKIREYFPADVVISGLFKVYSQMLGVSFVEAKRAKVWDPTVKMFEIHDVKPSGPLIGYFYTDFIPRKGKYGHAAAFPLISGRMLDPAGSVYSTPVSAIVANLAAPAAGKPSLLSRDEVETIFHEFGHIMHQTLTRAPYASLSGSSVAQDFVEAPSQMLENWTWDSQVLKLLSAKYDDHSQKLPEELLKQMIAARDFQQAYFYTRQLMLATLDMDFHTESGPVDTTSVYHKLYREMIGVESVPGTHFSAGFGHLMGGYDAGYYGYLWSEVYAQDMFSRFQEKGLLSPEMGAWYRKNILEHGNMADAMDLLREFLGREPNNAAFLKKLGITR